MERYVKDMLIEMHTLKEIVDTVVLPAAFTYSGTLATAAANAVTAGIKVVPQVAAANELGTLIESLRDRRNALVAAIEKAEGLHDDLPKQAKFLTSTGADSMLAVREVSDQIELSVSDECWPLPKYREILFPV
jgi:glutamine synthetase